MDSNRNNLGKRVYLFIVLRGELHLMKGPDTEPIFLFSSDILEQHNIINPIRPGPCNFGRRRPINVFHDDSLSFQPILMKQTRKESSFRLVFRHPSFTSNRNSQ